MTAVLRAWLGFLALGAGLLHLALTLGSPPAIAVPLVLVGAAEFGWGVFALTRPSLPVPRIARAAVVVPLAGWALLLALTANDAIPGVRVLPMLIASLLDLGVAVGITAVLRRDAAADRPLPARRHLAALGAGALVVIALTAPALAATEAGDATVRPGGPGVPALPHGH